MFISNLGEVSKQSYIQEDMCQSFRGDQKRDDEYLLRWIDVRRNVSLFDTTVPDIKVDVVMRWLWC